METITITKREDSLSDHQFWFSNGIWVSINEKGSYYEWENECNNDYIDGELEIEDNCLEGYDGCFELPQEVILACKDLGMKISKYIN
jgi:hypothetical protein